MLELIFSIDFTKFFDNFSKNHQRVTHNDLFEMISENEFDQNN
jgi:hypothetical protein